MGKLDEMLNTKVKDRQLKPNRRIQWIHYSKLKRSPYQFYDAKTTEIEMLADTILADKGILQNLIVRKIDADKYEIIAGHKRALAAEFISKVRKVDKYDLVPCEVKEVDDVVAQWMVMTTNRYHKKTQYEIMKEIEDMKSIIEDHPEYFDEDVKGRLVNKIADELDLCKSVVCDYQYITHNLSAEGKAAFKDGRINKSVAIELAKLDKKEQKELLKDNEELSIKKVKEYKKSKDVPNFGTENQDVPNFGTENQEDEDLPGQMKLDEFLEEETQSKRYGLDKSILGITLNGECIYKEDIKELIKELEKNQFKYEWIFEKLDLDYKTIYSKLEKMIDKHMYI